MRGRGKSKNTLKSSPRVIFSPLEKELAQAQADLEKDLAMTKANQAKGILMRQSLDVHFKGYWDNFELWVEHNAYDLGIDESLFNHQTSFAGTWDTANHYIHILVLGNFFDKKLGCKPDNKEIANIFHQELAQIHDEFSQLMPADLQKLLSQVLDKKQMDNRTSAHASKLLTMSNELIQNINEKIDNLAPNGFKYNSPKYHSLLAQQEVARLIPQAIIEGFNYQTLEDTLQCSTLFANVRALDALCKTGAVQLDTNGAPNPTSTDLNQAIQAARVQVGPHLIELAKKAVDAALVTRP